MKLQILIPQYKETDEIIKPLLDSIAMQQCIDFKQVGVIICNDGTDVRLSDKLISSYPFKIEYYLCEHRGVSATRNECLDHAIADYVMFCDSDDMFSDMCGLYAVFEKIDKYFDTLVSAFIEEAKHDPTGEMYLIKHEHDSTFVHGKVHRRQYLTENNIRFNDALTIHEDSFFNILCQSLTENVAYIETPFYLWKWRDDSICRRDPKYMLKTYNNMIDSVDALIEALTLMGEPNKAIYHVLAFLFDTYYTMQKPEWKDPENIAFREATEKRFAEYYAKWKDTWLKVEPHEKVKVSEDVRGRNIEKGMLIETITVDDWLKAIEENI